MDPQDRKPAVQRLSLEVLERIAFHLGSPFDQAFQDSPTSVIYGYLRMGSLVCRVWRPAFQRRLVSEVVLAGWKYDSPSPWPMAHKLLESGHGPALPDDDFATDASEIFAGLSVRTLFVNTFDFLFNEETIRHLHGTFWIENNVFLGHRSRPFRELCLRVELVELTIVDPVHWDGRRGQDCDPPLSLPCLEKLVMSSSDMPGVMDLPLNVNMPCLHYLQLYVHRRAWDDRTDLGKWVDVLFGGTRGARLRTLECSVLIGESDALQFLDALLRHLPLCTSLETVKLEASHLEQLGNCICAIGSNDAPCRILKLHQRGMDCKVAAGLAQLWSLLTTSLETDAWRHLEVLRIDLTVNRLELASEIPDLATLLEAAKQSRAVELREDQVLPHTTPEERELQRPLRHWIRDHMGEAGLADACWEKDIRLKVVFRFM